ncbi:methyltransferase domain-containing protein [Peterkaempfera bronchialis]|uniref:methyltransferase domain-containing protein n=1 Tax=Peterkaempfera bronchialis TaxID=2126346 RepID=UPI0022483A15|nr:methyltransferase domain-containing protein [Peterkaempfera bronchialis]
MVARTLDELLVGGGHRVLEIGTGSGYSAALLAHRVGAERVVTVEAEAGRAAEAERRLAAAGYGGVAVVVGDGAQGWAAGAPYDRVVARCGVGTVAALPGEWVAQCRPGAVILAPVGGGLVRLRVAVDGTAAGRFLAGRVRVGGGGAGGGAVGGGGAGGSGGGAGWLWGGAVGGGGRGVRGRLSGRRGTAFCLRWGWRCRSWRCGRCTTGGGAVPG